jgi:hypothetical protein
VQGANDRHDARDITRPEKGCQKEEILIVLVLTNLRQNKLERFEPPDSRAAPREAKRKAKTRRKPRKRTIPVRTLPRPLLGMTHPLFFDSPNSHAENK